jgi:NADH:ubiquinone oxidoreductase subunit 2 (subunit N)
MLNFIKKTFNLFIYISKLSEIEICSIFVWCNSVFLYVFTTLCHDFTQFKNGLDYYNLGFDMSRDAISWTELDIAYENFIEFTSFWVLQFEIIVGFLFLIWIFYLCFFMFISSENKYEYLQKLLGLMFLCVLVLDFSIFWIYITCFLRDVKFFFLNNLVQIDLWVIFSRIWVLFFFKIVLIFVYNQIKFSSSSSDHPVFLFLLFSGVIVSLFINSVVDIFLNFMLLEILSFITVGIAAFSLSNISLEACIKYFINNTIVSGISLYGFFCIFFITKNSSFGILRYIFEHMYVVQNANFVFFLFAVALWITIFLFKLNIFPVCFYVLDLYESLSSSTIVYLSSIIKPAIFFMFCKIYFLMLFWLPFINVLLFELGLLSILISSVMAIYAIKIKKFIGITSIWLYGFLLVCLATSSMEIMSICLIYLFIYNIALSLFFSVVSMVFLNSKQHSNLLLFSELGFVFKSDNLYKGLLTFSILLVSGLPPLFLFIYKYIIFLILFTVNHYVFVFFICLINVISFYYYLNILKYLWVYDESDFNNKFDFTRNTYHIQTAGWFRELMYFLFYMLVVLFILTLFKFDILYLTINIILQSIWYAF